MTDYTELVEALLCGTKRAATEHECKICPYFIGGVCCWTIAMKDAAAAIEELQAELEKKRTADCWGCKCEKLEPKRGEWIDRYDEDDKPFFKRKYVCTACGGWNTYGKSDYCPKCGAKMDGERKEGEE